MAAIAANLGNPVLCDPATTALASISTAAAQQTLLDALPNAQDTCRVQIIKALGDLRVDAAAPVLARLLTDSDDVTLMTARHALAEIGAKDAPPIPKEVIDRAGPGDPFTNDAAVALLHYARRRAEEGATDEAVKWCGVLASQGNTAAQLRAAALELLVETRGRKAMDDLWTAMDDMDPQYRAAALALAAKVPGRSGTRAWVAKLEDVSPEVRAEIIYMLGGRDDHVARKAVLEALEDESEVLHLAAMEVVTRYNAEKARAPVFQLLSQGSEGERLLAQAALLRVPGAGVVDDAAAALLSAAPEVQVALIEILAVRQATNYRDTIFALTASEERGVRLAALEAMPAVGAADDLPRLADRLAAASRATDARAVRAAIAALAEDIDEKEERADAVLDRLGSATPEEAARLIAVLPELPSESGLAWVAEKSRAPEAPVRDASVDALTAWPKDTALAPILDLLRETTDADDRRALLEGYLAVVDRARVARSKRVAVYKAALAVATETELAALAIAELPKTGSVAGLRVLESYFSNAGLAQAAAEAAIRLACPKNEDDKGLLEAEAAPILAKALSITDDDALREMGKKHLALLPVPDAGGFAPIFNGQDLTGWTGDTAGYVTEAGMLVCKPGGNLYTQKEYGDFVLRFEFRLPPGGNNGLAIRAPLGGGAYNGMELQVLDNSAEKYANLQPYQYHGSIYGVVPAKRGHQKPVGEWNTQEVTAKGRRITVVLNGAAIVDADLDEATASGTMDGKEHKGLDREEGRIGFLGHGDRVEFRNIRVKELDN